MYCIWKTYYADTIIHILKETNKPEKACTCGNFYVIDMTLQISNERMNSLINAIGTISMWKQEKLGLYLNSNTKIIQDGLSTSRSKQSFLTYRKVSFKNFRVEKDFLNKNIINKNLKENL